MRDLIHLAHGNGFPALCYKQLLNELAIQFDYCYIDRIGHDPLYPISENWHNLVSEVLSSIQRQADRPVIAVGHSLGGVLSLLAAIEQPKLFKAVIMLDSPLIGPFKSNMIRLAKALGIIDRVTPAFRTKNRREHWQSHDQLLHYLKTRELFKTFSDKCLEDYIAYGLELRSDGYYLRFNRHIEYEIYKTIPHIIPSYKNKLITPSVLIYGDKSTVVDRMDVGYMKKHFKIKCYKTKGTHLFPMEYPKVAGKQIISALATII